MSWLTLSRYFAYASGTAAMIVLFICGKTIPIGKIFWGHSTVLWNPDYLSNPANLNDAIRSLDACVLSLVGCSVSFVLLMFTATLYYGIKERQPGYIAVYIVFGIHITILVAMGAVFTMFETSAENGGYVLIGCGIYSACLLVLFMGYKEVNVTVAIATVMQALASDQ